MMMMMIIIIIIIITSGIRQLLGRERRYLLLGAEVTQCNGKKYQFLTG